MNLTEDDHVIVRVIPRRWVTIVDNEVEDYGSDCLGIESYIWNGKELVSEEEYTQELLTVTPEVTSGELQESVINIRFFTHWRPFNLLSSWTIIHIGPRTLYILTLDNIL